MATTKTAKTNNDAKKIKEMQKTIEELNNMVKLLMSQNNNVVTNNMDRDVTFVSLCNHTLNLSTEPYGGGEMYTFTEFGEEQSIPYSDARKIVKTHKNFIQGGKCYIADDELIKTEHLTEAYKKLLDKDSLLELLFEERNKFFKIFDTMTDTQKEIFKDIVFDRLSKDKNSVDMNIVQYINDKLNVDLLNEINLSKELLTIKD